MPVTKRRNSYFMTNNPELKTTIRVNQKKLEDAHVLIQVYEEKLAKYETLYAENEKKIKQLEKDNVLLQEDVTSLNGKLSRLSKISKTSDTFHEKNCIIEKKQAENVQVCIVTHIVIVNIFILIHNLFRMRLIEEK